MEFADQIAYVYHKDTEETVIFSGGVELNIPDVDIPAVTSLPAWKR